MLKFVKLKLKHDYDYQFVGFNILKCTKIDVDLILLFKNTEKDYIFY